MCKFTQKHVQISFCSKLKQPKWHKNWTKTNPQTKICKNKPILIKKAQKEGTRKSSKQPANPQKTRQIRGKTARLATLLQKFKGAFFLYCELYIGNIIPLAPPGYAYGNNNFRDCTTTDNKRRNNYQYCFFNYYLHSISCITNWPTWNLNAVRWSKNFRNDASTYWSKRSFLRKKQGTLTEPLNWRNSTTCFAEHQSTTEPCSRIS